jgi:hypothetical protein
VPESLMWLQRAAFGRGGVAIRLLARLGDEVGRPRPTTGLSDPKLVDLWLAVGVEGEVAGAGGEQLK